MNPLKRIITSPAIPLFASVIIHGTFLVVASGIGAFDFLHGSVDTPIAAMLISDDASQALSVSRQGSAPNIARDERGPSHVIAEPEALSNASSDIPEESAVLEKNGPPEYSEPPEAARDLPFISSLHSTIPATPAPVQPERDSVTIPLAPMSASLSSVPGPTQEQVVENRSELLKHTREKLSFNLYWLDVCVGRAELDAIRNEGKVVIRSRIHSAPIISAFYKVDDDASSMVVNGAPADFRIKQREGRYRSDKEIVFDPGGKHVTFFNYIKGTQDEHPLNGDLWDLISGFYYLRTQPFEIGKIIYINIFDSDKFYKAEVNVIGKETLRISGTKELATVIVRPVIKSEGLFKHTGEILVWLTDDDNKTPVKIETKAPIGKVVAILTSLETE